MSPPQAARQSLRIDGLTVAGDGVGRLPGGQVIFVPGALPGDHVRVDLDRVVRGVQQARLVAIEAASPARIEPRCRQWACGGCPLRALDGAAQAQHKRRHLIDSMRRIAGLDVEAITAPMATAGDGWGQRHRVRLHAAHAQGRWQLGYHGAGSRQVVEVAGCPVVWPELEALIARLQSALADRPLAADIRAIDLVYSRRDGRGAAKLVTSGPLAALRRPLDWLEAAGLSAVDICAADGRYVHGNCELRYDHAHSEAFDLRYEPGLFTQAACEVNDQLVAAVIKLARVGPRPQVLELYAGIGNFTAPLARQGAAVVAYESAARAAVLCRRNNQAAGLRVEVVTADAARAMEEPDVFDVVLLDPPRSGAGSLMVDLARRRPKRIIYVACDPATLARDSRVLVAGGWSLRGLTPFDMFPQTSHLECLAFFERDQATS